MSILLEALKKSEDERARRARGEPVYAGQVQGAGSISNRLPMLAALVFGGVAAGLAAWVFLGGKAANPSGAANVPAINHSGATHEPAIAEATTATRSTAPLTTTTSTGSAATDAVVAAAAAAPALRAASTAAASAAPAAQTNRSLYATGKPDALPSANKADKSAAASAKPAATSAAANQAAAKASAPAAAVASVKSVASAASAAQRPDTPTPKPPIASNNKPNTDTPGNSIQTRAPSSEIVSLNDLPPELRAELPAMRVAGYMHAEDSQERLIGINDRLVRAGDEVAPGLMVQSVSPGAVVMGYKGYRFRITP